MVSTTVMPKPGYEKGIKPSPPPCVKEQVKLKRVNAKINLLNELIDEMVKADVHAMFVPKRTIRRLKTKLERKRQQALELEDYIANYKS